MECHKVSIPFSKKLSSSHSFSGASIYDGVFGGGPMNVRSRVEEDYGKIFGGSSSSSIPVLDVPELNERKICVDVKSSKLDYSKIFGGFGECDFAVSYEELSAESKKRHSFVEEARTASETGSHPSNVSAENQDSSEAEASCQSVDGRKQFKMSYHRAKQERKSGTNGTTHVTQLNAVPGYTCLIDEFAPSRITEDVGKPLLSAVNGTRLNTNFSGEILQGKHRRKTLSVHSPGGSSKQASRDGVNFQNEYNHSRSYPNDVLFDACEIGFRTRVPKVPVPSSQSDGLINNKGDSKTSVGSKTEVSNGHSSEDATGFCSPTYFDEEVDVNSVAATSAAAVKKAIEEAQARIRIAKEIMERKKDGLQNHVKPRFKKHPKAEECREDKFTNEFREEARKKCEKVDAPIQDFASLGTENAMKAEQAALDFRERDSLFSAKEASGETQGDKNNATLMKDRQEEMKDLKEEKWGGIGAKLVRSVNDIFKERIFTMKMFEKPEEDGKKLKTFGEGQEHEDVERKMNAVQGACELKEGSCKAKSGEWVEDQEEYGQKSTVSGVQEEHEMTFKASHNVETREKKQRRLWDLTASKYKVEMQLKDNKHELKGGACEPMSDQGVRDQKEYGKESKFAGLQVEKEVKASHEVGASEKKQRRLWDLTANEFKLEIQLKDNERTKMRKLKDEHAWLASEKKQREVLEQKETDIRSEDLAESEEDEEALKEICENGKTNEATYESVQFEKQQETCGWEENEEGLEDVHGREDSENKSDEAREQENVEVTINEFHDGKQSGKKLQEDFESGAEGRVLEAEENEQMLKEAYGMKEIDKRLEESCEWAETEEIKREIEPREDEKMKVTQEVCNFRNNLEAANDVCEQDKNEILHETLEASVHDEYDEYLEVSTHEENGEGVEVTRALSECKEMETEVNDQEEKGIFEFKIAGLAQVFLEHTGIQKEVEDTTEVQASERNGLNIGVSDTNAWQKQSDQRDKESKAVCNAGNFYEGTCESEEKFEEVEAAIEQGEDESNSEFSHEERWFYNGENMEATQLPSMFQGKGESTEIADDIKTSQNIEHKENHSETLKTEGREVEGTMQNEVELQKEHVRKTDGAKEKEREREKERIAVERAIREARERAFTEARERAAVEKANAEARRRAMAGARERLEKTSAEVNDKSSADKTSMEARLKAERTAVERATAEARVRALEKAMSKKATSKARNQAVKSSGASRENGMRNNSAANDSQYRGSGPNRIPHSINESDEANGGSVQRHEARSESHQRVAERAAKALAEKNKRDLLAQKEQAERNRLAEALDIDVRRWSSGKTGNLRALLSTLHYILGPDSGWQPIPLTDLIATAAVKKAYRKATLCVHPDKLQQRGASIQQKYTCEKVFDLLKEAWNKFNAEER